MEMTQSRGQPRAGGRRLYLAAAALFAAIAFTLEAGADSTSPKGHDVVELVDGTQVEGNIIEMKRDAFVIVEVAAGVRAMISWRKIKKVTQGSTAPAPEPSQPAQPAPKPAPPAPGVDTVTLKTGQRIDGKVVRQAPGQFVILRTTDGPDRTFNWDVIREVFVAPGAPPNDSPAAPTSAVAAVGGVASAPSATGSAASPGPTVTTKTEAQVGSNGAQLDYSRDCAATPNDPQCHTAARVVADAKGVSAHVESKDDTGKKSADVSAKGLHAELERECSANPGDARCSQKESVDVGSGGLSVSYRQENVERVKTPPSATTNFSVDVGGGTLLGLPNGMSMAFLISNIRMRILAGAQFPGPKGGIWNGIVLEPSVAIMSVFVSLPDNGFGTGGTSSTVLGFQLGGTLGWQIMSFGKMDESSLKQSGVGFMVGGYAGATGIASVGGGDMMWNASYGPAIALSFPSYNAGTASYSAFSITGMVLPTGSSTLLMASLGWIF